jgi:hypothetical protein
MKGDVQLRGTTLQKATHESEHAGKRLDLRAQDNGVDQMKPRSQRQEVVQAHGLTVQ